MLNTDKSLVPLQVRPTPLLSLVAAPHSDLPPLRHVLRRPALLGWLLVALFLAGFGSWAATMPIASGAVAPGIVSPDGSRRTVQHLEGGLIASIAVRDGDFVQAGQPVLVLQNVQASSLFDELHDQYLTLLATRSRLNAELFGQASIAFPPELLHETGGALDQILASQRAVFDSRRSLLEAQKEVLRSRLEQGSEQINALRAQTASTEAQIALLSTEIDSKKQLLGKALVARSEIMLLERQRADLDGQRNQLAASIAEIGQKQGEIRSQLLSLDASRTDEIASDLDKTRAALASAAEQLTASRDVLERTVVRAPVSGRVVNSRFTSPGGVVGKGEPIMDIVPTEERLLVDARIAVTDVDVVHAGLAATIRLTALDYYRLPRIEGVVQSVSADRIVDPNNGQSYYLARVEVEPAALTQAAKDVQLVPGMPAEVMIVTGERTLLQYLLEPFEATFQRSFSEA